MKKRRAAKTLENIKSLYPTILITGPRQTGKTWLARNVFPNHEWVLLDSNALLKQAKEDPGLFLKNHPPPVIFDEIQKAPELFSEIKFFVDSFTVKPGSIILTGSQPLPLMQAVSESLAGRVGMIELCPMDALEIAGLPDEPKNFFDLVGEPPIGKSFNISSSPLETLFRGGFPAMALDEITPQIQMIPQRFFDYTSTYLTRDLRDLAQIQDLGRFERWLRLLSTISGRIPNISELAGQLGIPQSTAQEWLEILKASMLFFEFSAFHSQVVKRETKRRKLAICDSGLMCNLLGYTSPSQLEISPLLGTIFETSVLNSLRAITINQGVKIPLFHWRSREKDEVDVVIEKDAHTHFPVEIKFSNNVSRSDIRGLYSFMNIYTTVKLGVVITPNDRCYWVDEKILHIPWGAL